MTANDVKLLRIAAKSKRGRRFTYSPPCSKHVRRLGNDHGPIRRSQPPRIGGPTCWLTHASEKEYGAPTWPSGRTPFGSLRSCAQSFSLRVQQVRLEGCL
jgi:hypothetical protein